MSGFMRQSDVAEVLGIAQTVYSRYERGFQSIPVEHLLRLSSYYKVSCDYLLGVSDVPEIRERPAHIPDRETGSDS